MISDQAILRHIERQPHRSAGYKQLVREMSIRGEERRQLAARLQAMVNSGRLIETSRDRFTLAEHAAAQQNLIAGRLTMHRDGYGFVIPNAGQRSTIEGDIYVSPQAIGSAMHGDQVLVELGRRKGVKADVALDKTNARFLKRFAAMEKLADEKGLAFSTLDQTQKDALWKEVKATEAK